MAHKPERKKPTGPSTRNRESRKAANPSWGWINRIALALLAGGLCSALLPRLQFIGIVEPAFTWLFSLSMAAFVFGLTSVAGKRFAANSSFALLIAFVAVLFANMGMQFKWIDPNPIAVFLGVWLVIPVGLVWAVSLAQRDHDAGDTEVQESIWVTFRQPGYLIPFVLILALGAFLVFYRLGYYNFWEDEGLMINAAIGIRDQGMTYLKEGYSRGWIDTWMISKSLVLFGESEWSARLPSACFGILFILASVYVFYKWFRLPWVAFLVPLLCLLTDEFLLLFRYARMYAPLIPVFLVGIYLTQRFIASPLDDKHAIKWIPRISGFNLAFGIGALGSLVLAIHFHSLAAVAFLAAYCLTGIMTLTTRLKKYKVLLAGVTGFALLVFILAQAGVPGFKLIPQAIRRLMREDQPEMAYYQFLFNNGLPANVTLMAFIAGAGLFFHSKWDRAKKIVFGFMYLIVVLALVFMVYLMADEGRDYRYISHIVPFVMGIQLLVLYYSGKGALPGQKGLLLLMIPMIYTAITFSREYKEIYVRHPWAPWYSVAYKEIREGYKPGEAILYQHMKTYYLDPEALAGEKAIKLGRRKEMTLEQFKGLFRQEKSGWIVFDTHKSYHLDREILNFIVRHARKIHGTGIDETGVEVFYFQQE